MKTTFCLVLLLLVAITKPAKVPLFDLEGSAAGGLGPGSGSGSHFGSGSGGGEYSPSPSPSPSPTPIQHCSQTSSSNLGDLNETRLSLEDVFLRSRCFAACLDVVLLDTDDHQQLPLSLLDKSSNLPWDSVSIASLRNNCPLYNKVHQCQQGCQYRHLSELSSCATDCVDDCHSDSPYLPDSACPRKCDQSLCSLGCHHYTTINEHQVHRADLLPVFPNGTLTVRNFTSPYFHQVGAYSLNYTHNSSAHLSNHTLNHTLFTSYLVQLRTAGNTNVFNYWMMSLQDVLLVHSSIKCQIVSLKFLPINKYGNASNFSSPVTVWTNEELYPDIPDHPQPYSISIVPDTHLHENRASVNISWLEPHKYRFATKFSVHITSFNSSGCGSSRNLSMPKTQLSVLWTPNVPLHVMPSVCNYEVKIYSVPHHRHFPGTPQSIPFNISTHDVLPTDYNYTVHLTADFSVKKLLTFHTFAYRLNWILPVYPRLTQGITRFKIYQWLGRLSPSGEFIRNSIQQTFPVKFQKNTYNYSQLITAYDVNDQINRYYLFELETVYSSPNNRFILDNSTVLFDARAVPPNEARDVQLQQFVISSNGSVTLRMTWMDPKDLDEDVNFWVNIGLQELVGDDSTPKDTDVLLIETSAVFNNPNKGSIIFSNNLWSLYVKNTQISQLHRLPKTERWTFYIQVLTVSNIPRNSNWTRPIVVTIPSVLSLINSSSSSTTDSPKPSTTTTTRGVSDTPTVGVEPRNTAKQLIPIYGSVSIIVILIIAIVVATILLLAAYIQNRRLRDKPDRYYYSDGNSFGYTGAASDWEINSDAVEKVSLIGTGTFGPVYRARLTGLGKGKKAKECKDIAMMTLKASASEHEKRDFSILLEQYKAVGSMKDCGHPSLISLVGYASGNTPFMVTELSAYGDLLTFLVNSRQKLSDDSTDPYGSSTHYCKINDLSPTDLLDFAKQIASAMDCLSGLGIVHRDLACRNIYLDSGMTVKIGSFGIVTTHQKREDVYPNEMPLRWMAMETIIEHNFTSASDVWSYGVTLWEIITLGGFPYKDIPNDKILSLLTNGQRLQCPPNSSLQFFTILQSCWDSDPNCRPTFELLHETLLNQLTQGDCRRLVSLDTNRDFQSSPSQISDDSALGCSPLPIVAPREINDTCSSHGDIVIGLSQPSSTHSLIPSAVNLTFRKDSLDPQVGFKKNFPPVSSGHRGTNLDSPVVRVAIQCPPPPPPSSSINVPTDTIDESGATEV